MKYAQKEKDEFNWPCYDNIQIYGREQITLPIEEMGIYILSLVDAMSKNRWIKIENYSRGHPFSQYPMYPKVYFYCELKELNTLCEVLNASECDFAWEFCFYNLVVNYNKYSTISQKNAEKGWIALILEIQHATSYENAIKRLALGFTQQSQGIELLTIIDEDIIKMKQLGVIS
jgi:hypothetical protein